ncbi:SIMPL domain-containing protein [Mangrovibacterium sp.]|uniref:SIMPL domain-containing protein n=1 Tax=Mangrovibacterium sp. TaxID=1961364 RepID=UPI0035661C94
MKTTISLLTFLLATTFLSAQSTVNPLESTPYIEVTGEGEMEVIPDEIYLQFTLTERYEGRNKSDLKKLESEMRKKLNAAGLNMDHLSVADANSDYVKIVRKKKDVLASKDYEMKIKTTDELSRLWDLLDDMKAEKAFISRVDHSDMDALKRDVKILAVKNAKEKSDYLLNALNQRTGKVLFIQERETYSQPYLRKTMALSMMDAEADIPPVTEQELSFQKIKLNYKVFARFSIQ